MSLVDMIATNCSSDGIRVMDSRTGAPHNEGVMHNINLSRNCRMIHSLSTPSGVDGIPSTSNHKGGKKLTVRIQLLDDTVTMFQVQVKVLGRVLFEQVCRQLNLLEADYFGLEYQDNNTGTKYWLDLEKPLNRQVDLSLIDPILRFCVKFYTPDPSQLEEEYTRYLFCLQIKRDLATGNLQCNDNTAALMASYIVQASCGDFVAEDYPDHTYLSSYKFVPHQDATMQNKIMENHRKHVGQSPAEADLNLLETARRCELYGMKMHSAKDHDGMPLNLAVAHMGIAVFQNITRINTFSWAKIRKISFKRKRFLVKLHPEGYGFYKDTVEFMFDERNACKNFWKKCVENHGFFRCAVVENLPRRKTKVLSRGSSFRYSGRTQKQIIDFVRENYVKRQNFERSQSFRQGSFNACSRSQSHTYVNSSVSANPLLPIDTVRSDIRNQSSDLMTPSLSKKITDTLERSTENATAALVEIYPPKKFALESDPAQPYHLLKTADPLNLKPPAPPQVLQTWNSQNNNNQDLMSQPKRDQHMTGIYQSDHSSSGLSHLYSSNIPQRISVASQAYIPMSPRHITVNSSKNMKQTMKTQIYVEDLKTSVELGQREDQLEKLIQDDSQQQRNLIVVQEQPHLQQKETISKLKTKATLNGETTSQYQTSPRPQVYLEESVMTPTVKQILYSNINYSTSKQSTLNNTTSTETETDNIIYTDINDHYKYPNLVYSHIEDKISNSDTINLNGRNDIYATVNRKNKSKSREKHFSNEFIDESILQYTQAKRFDLPTDIGIPHSSTSQIEFSNLNCQIHNDLNHPSDSTAYFNIKFNTKNSPSKFGNNTPTIIDRKLAYSDNYLNPSIDSQLLPLAKGIPRHTYSLPRDSGLLGVDSIDSDDSHYLTHHSIDNIKKMSNVPDINSPYGNHLQCKHDKNNATLMGKFNVNSPLNRYVNSSEKLEYQLSSANLYSTVHYVKNADSCNTNCNEEDKAIENIYDQVEKECWLKSTSCKDLYDFSTYYEREKFKPMVSLDKGLFLFNRIDSPITRYDDSRHSMYFTKNYSIDGNRNNSHFQHSKIYSSSYPGSIYKSQYHQNSDKYKRMYYLSSQDDISQDSYELLEKYDIDLFSRHHRSEGRTRSCSLDSGNYIPSDDELISEQHKYTSVIDIKYGNDFKIHKHNWHIDDPLYLPREKLCVNSDGNFYKNINENLSRTSSQESQNDVFERKISPSSDSSKKSRDSLYHTDSKKSRETSKTSKTSMVSSQFSKESLVLDFLCKNYEMPTTTGKKYNQINQREQYLSSQDSKSDYYDALESVDTDSICGRHKVKSHDCLLSDTHSADSSFYDSRDTYSTFPSNKSHRTSKVHSISLQNVDIERNAKSFANKSPEAILTSSLPIKKREEKEIQTNDSIDQTTPFKTKDSQLTKISMVRQSSDSENIFSFDQDRIDCIEKLSKNWESPTKVNKEKSSVEYPLTPELISEFEKQKKYASIQLVTRKEELIAKTHFEEYNTVIAPTNQSHTTVERTKSDPNSLANQSRKGINSRRHVLMHQKSIDLTPADSSDEDYIYKQIPSAPPLYKPHGNICDIKNYKAKGTSPDKKQSEFEMPKSYFAEYDKCSSKTSTEEIPYVLHKRHVMNGTAPTPPDKKQSRPKSPKSPKSIKAGLDKVLNDDFFPNVLDSLLPTETKEFLYAQNIGISKVDSITLEKNKSIPTIQLSSPKRDITMQMDPLLLEKLNKKLSQIESDSATSSRTESIQQHKNKLEQKQLEIIRSVRQELQINARKSLKSKLLPKTKVSTKSNKAKTRITSFSSDDESLDSDDVFGSAEAIPAHLEFSPPQSRKEIEPILRIEQSRLMSAAWGRGQTMSSTEIEGSPPQCRRLAELESRYHTNINKLDPQYVNATELRRISERSISIPSSEDEPHVPNQRRDQCTNEYQFNENIPSPILENSEFFRSDDNIFEASHKENITQIDIDYTLKKNTSTGINMPKCRVKMTEEIIGSSILMRSMGHAPILFAHARLNLSEGSLSLKRLKTSLSPSSGRRARSLDTPIISLHRLPPINAFSSKDDTVALEEEAEILEEKPLQQIKCHKHDDDTANSVHSCEGSIPTQSNYTVKNRDLLLNTITIDEDEMNLLDQLKYIEKIALQGVKIKDKKKSKMKLKSGDHLILSIPKYRYTDWSPYSSGNSSRKTSPGVSRASSMENTSKGKFKALDKSKPLVPRSRPESRRTSAEDIKQQVICKDAKNKKANLKDPPRPMDSCLINREKSKTQEETESDIAKRKKRQQKLYESAIKQTITMLSPTKDALPSFTTSEDKISVKTEGDKIIIETEFKCNVTDHVLITKAPRKLDTLVKFSRSFDDDRSLDKLEKVSRSFEDRKKSFEEFEQVSTSNIVSTDVISKSLNKITSNQDRKQTTGDFVSIQNKIDMKSNSIEKAIEHDQSDIDLKHRSLDDKRDTKKIDIKPIVRSAVGDRRMFAHQFNIQEDIDMQAVISERRSLEILKRSLPSEDTKDSGSQKPSPVGSLDSNVPIDSNHSTTVTIKKTFSHRVPTIECEAPSIEEDICVESTHLKVSQTNINRLSLDRSRSDETGSWMTVECDEFVGSDTSENEPRTLEPERNLLETQATLDDAIPLEYSNCTTPTSDLNILVTPPNVSPLIDKSVVEIFENYNATKDQRAKRFLEKQSERSKSSDSWTSVEKDVTPPKEDRWCLPINGAKEKTSMDEESSVSCSIARPMGISQEFGDAEEKQSMELKQKILSLEKSKSVSQDTVQLPIMEKNITVANYKVAQSKVMPTKHLMHTLEKQSPIDLSSESYLDPIEEKITKLLQRSDEAESSSGSHKKLTKIEKPHKKLIGERSDNNKNKSGSSSQESKSSFDSKDSLSVESKEDAEGSSTSFEERQFVKGKKEKDEQETCKSISIKSTRISNMDEAFCDEKIGDIDCCELSNIPNDFWDNDTKDASPDEHRESDTSFHDEFPPMAGFSSISSLNGIGVSPTDIVGYNTGFMLGRTLSRISERSTASEKSSMDDDISKASTHSISIRDESVASTDHQPSLSSDSRSNTNLAYISDADRRTSAEMPEIPCDSATGDRLSSFDNSKEPKSPTMVTGRFSITQVEEPHEEKGHHTLMCLSNAGSQDSEDWPLPDIPFDHVPVKPEESLCHTLDTNKSAPKSFYWSSNKLLNSQDSQDWPSPPSSATNTPIKGMAFYSSEVQSAQKESFSNNTESDLYASNQKKLSLGNSSLLERCILPYDEGAYMMSSGLDIDNTQNLNQNAQDMSTCLRSTLSAAACLSHPFTRTIPTSQKPERTSSLRKGLNLDPVIVSQPLRSPTTHSPLSEDDDVFMSEAAHAQFPLDESNAYLRKLSRSSNNSDTSVDEVFSTSAVSYVDDETTVRRNYEPRLSVTSRSYKKISHSSHSEEETSSIGTDLGGTVRMGLQQKKCTHSSHSEDTSINLSISEWSTGTNTVRQYTNLSGSDSLSAVSTQSCAKSEKSNHTKSSSMNKSAESLNEQSNNTLTKLSGGNGSSGGFRYDILSSSETDKTSGTTSATKSDDTTITLTEVAHTITEWSTSSSKTLAITTPGDQGGSGNCRGSSAGNDRTSPKEEKPNSLAQVRAKNGIIETGTIKDNLLQKTSEGVRPGVAKRLGDNKEHSLMLDRKRKSLEIMSKRYQSQEIVSENEAFVEGLYSPNEKFTDRYQSQEFIQPMKTSEDLKGNVEHQTSSKRKLQVSQPILKALLKQMKVPGAVEKVKSATVVNEAIHKNKNIPPVCLSEKSKQKPPIPNVPPIISPDEKFLVKHPSYHDKTLSKSQIREYKTNKMVPPNAVHKRINSPSPPLSRESSDRIENVITTVGWKYLPITNTITNTINIEDEPNLVNCSVSKQKMDSMVKYCSYFSNSLSSESSRNHFVQKPPRKGSIARIPIKKDPGSGNDTDNSIEMQDTKVRSRGYRRKRQNSTKSVKSIERTFSAPEYSEHLEDYKHEIHSDPFISNEESQNEFLHKNGKEASKIFSTPVSLEYENDKITQKLELYAQGIKPQKDNVNIKPSPSIHPMPPPNSLPIKPARSKKAHLKRESSVNQHDIEPHFQKNTQNEASATDTEKNYTIMNRENSDTTRHVEFVPEQKLTSEDKESTPIEFERFACGLDIRVDPPPIHHDFDH